ncbi:MAG: TonB-dependent receptor plug domain-containing protein, partial [Flavisolibacter sp.]
QALLKDEWKVSEKTMITLGTQYLSKRILSNDRGRHRVDQAAGFVVVNQQVGNHFFASPALRLEWNERSGWELVPQVNLSYRIRKFQLRGSAGKTIRDADFTERFNNYNKTFVSSGRIGNPDLSPEQSISYEAGADYFLPFLKLSAGFFQRHHRQLIDYVPTPFDEMPRRLNLTPLGSYALAKNIASVRTTGFETDLVFAKSFNNKKEAWACLGFVWLNSASSSTTPSLYISSHAKLLTNFSVRYRFNRMAFTVNGIFKSRAEQAAAINIAKVDPNYFVMNVKAEVFAWKNKMAVFVQADNVFDSNYADLLGAQMPGRWLMGGIKISLSK